MQSIYQFCWFSLQDNVTFGVYQNQLYRAPEFFDIDSVTGIVSVKRLLTEDLSFETSYTVMYFNNVCSTAGKFPIFC